ncbi:hypothetical protein HYQ44_012621 [Verticillium longisporum]|nr:hypothetical protein HYQ44_012621 [Verticillium longisporum]
MGSHNLTKAVRLSDPVDTTAPYDVSGLAGKTILITGGALGIGAAFARQWASNGANIAVGDINDEAGQNLVAELREDHPKGTHHYFHCDVGNWDSQVAFFKDTAAASPHGGIDIVVANAGISRPLDNSHFENPVACADDPDAPTRPGTTTIDINITAAMHTAHLAMFWLPRNGGANKLNAARNATWQAVDESRDRCLLLLGSVAGLVPFVEQTQYTISKHAITGLFRCLRGSAWKHGIRVNMVCPYFISGSNMFPAAVEAVLLSGGAGGAQFPAVIDAATRLVADETIVGRALVIGPSVQDGDGPATLEGKAEKKAIWECYAEDYTDADMFVWRWVNIVNAVEKARGWYGVVADVLSILFRWK